MEYRQKEMIWTMANQGYVQVNVRYLEVRIKVQDSTSTRAITKRRVDADEKSKSVQKLTNVFICALNV